MPDFWQWGAGGDFRLLEVTPVESLPIQPLDPQFRIGQLEGAIKEALLYFEKMTTFADRAYPNSSDAANARQVIAKLKELINQ